MNATKKDTLAFVKTKLATDPVWAVKALVRIYQENQTADEQVSQTTTHDNGIGFSGWTAKSGTYFANWVRSGRSLSGKHLAKARKIALHHAGQLTRIANGEG